MKILVCGGAGYIGSHLVKELLRSPQHSVVILDSLSSGYRQAIPEGVPFMEGDIRDSMFLDSVFTLHQPKAVMHFCASISVPESCEEPLDYYENNVSGTINLLQAMKRHEVKVISISPCLSLVFHFLINRGTIWRAGTHAHPFRRQGCMSESVWGVKVFCRADSPLV